jgi:hypothetical protein
MIHLKKCLDIVGPFPETTKGNNVLTFQDDLSKFMTAIPIPLQDAKTIARVCVANIILKLGTPRQILTDRGANFLSDLFKNTWNLLKIKKLQTTAFRPESSGGLERSHRVLGEYLQYNVNEDQYNWDEWVPYAIMCIILPFTLLQDVHCLSLCMVSSRHPRPYMKRPVHSIVMTTMS